VGLYLSRMYFRYNLFRDSSIGPSLVFELSYSSVVNVEKSSESIRLVDDGFGKICNMMNDISMRVRAEAARLLVSLLLTYLLTYLLAYLLTVPSLL